MTCKSTVTRPAVPPVKELERGDLVELKEVPNVALLVTKVYKEGSYDGTIIASNNPDEVGEHHTIWSSTGWKPFHGTVTLQQD